MNYFFVDYENVKNLGLESIETLSADDTVIIFYSQNANTITFETHKKLCAAKASIIFERVNVGFKNALDFQLSSYLGYIIGKTEGCDANYYLVTNDAAFSVIGRFWARKGKCFAVVERISDVTDNGRTAPAIMQNAKKKPVKERAEEQAAEVPDTVAVPTDIGEAAAAAEEQTESVSAEDREETAEISADDENAKKTYEAPEITAEDEADENLVKITEITLVDEPKPTRKKGAARTKNQGRAKSKEVHDPELETKLETVLTDKTEIPVIVKIIKQYKTKQGINNALMKQFPSRDNQRSGEIYQAIKPLLTDKKGK